MRVVLPASGWLMMPKVRRFSISFCRLLKMLTSVFSQGWPKEPLRPLDKKNAGRLGPVALLDNTAKR